MTEVLVYDIQMKEGKGKDKKKDNIDELVQIARPILQECYHRRLGRCHLETYVPGKMVVMKEKEEVIAMGIVSDKGLCQMECVKESHRLKGNGRRLMFELYQAAGCPVVAYVDPNKEGTHGVFLEKCGYERKYVYDRYDMGCAYIMGNYSEEYRSHDWSGVDDVIDEDAEESPAAVAKASRSPKPSRAV
jgi:hypothetical protein